MQTYRTLIAVTFTAEDDADAYTVLDELTDNLAFQPRVTGFEANTPERWAEDA